MNNYVRLQYEKFNDMTAQLRKLKYTPRDEEPRMGHKGNKKFIVSRMEYPAAPEFLDPVETEMFENMLLFRSPEDWSSYVEILLLAQMCQLMRENMELNEQIAGMGNSYILSNGNEGHTMAYKSRNINLRIIMSITAQLHLTHTGKVTGKDKATLQDRGKEYHRKLEGEKKTFADGGIHGLLAKPYVPEG